MIRIFYLYIQKNCFTLAPYRPKNLLVEKTVNVVTQKMKLHRRY